MVTNETSRNPPRVIIERVQPEIDAGRHPAKRVVGDSVEVSADIYKDGHDVLGARVVHRPVEESTWHAAEMAYDRDEDRWSATFVVDRVGDWEFRVEAWADPFATWRRGLSKKLDAKLDVASELLEGATLVAAAAKRARGSDRTDLRVVAERLAQTDVPQAERVALALEDPLATRMAGLRDRRHDTKYDRTLTIVVDRERARFAAWYEMFPRSQSREEGRHGTLADAEQRLPEISALGFDVVYLPPIHPIGEHFRKGPNNDPRGAPDAVGSPWAIGSAVGCHKSVHPKLGTIEDFDRFVATAERHGLEVALDFALQCSPDHPWVKEHPEWFFVRPDGTIAYAENPPKKYQDIVPINFWTDDRQALWDACKDIVDFWIAHGVKTFRVDNPHTKPFAFWEWLIGEVKKDHPGVVFLSEAFTRPKPMKGLAKIGFSQSYTYFTWRNSAHELEEYLTELTHTEMAEYFRGNLFTNTPDILHEYLQRGGRPAFLVRHLLAATLSPLYGIYSGYELCENAALRLGSEEYLDSEKYEIRTRDWNAPGNINAEIRLVNRIRHENPALQHPRNLTFHLSENEQILFYRRSAPRNELLIAVNLNPFRAEETMVHVPLHEIGLPDDASYVVEDLLTGARYAWHGARNYVRLDPTSNQVGHVLRLAEPALEAA